jgi:Ser/Thr protein kinase RdoA (MazF antagonist)
MLATAREAFGWDASAAVTAGPRGELGQIWRVDIGPKSFALKEIFAEPPDVEAELAFTSRAVAAGVRLPATHAARDGRYLVTTPQGRWLRLYDWVDLHPIDLTAPSTPDEIGRLMARLHRCAPAGSGGDPAPAPPGGDPAPAPPGGDPAPAPPGGDPAPAPPGGDPWYDTVPEPHDYAGWVAPADPGALILCHRDLHPENVFAGPDGVLVVVDWDNFGPADPARELACGLFDWFFDGVADFDAMHRMHDAYVREGGPGRLTRPADFTMLIAIRMNFLALQRTIALDPAIEPERRERAEREVVDTLRRTPTPGQLAEVLELLTSRGRPGEAHLPSRC